MKNLIPLDKSRINHRVRFEKGLRENHQFASYSELYLSSI